jgi:hypothetical protein
MMEIVYLLIKFHYGTVTKMVFTCKKSLWGWENE